MASTLSSFECRYLDNRGQHQSLAGVTVYLHRAPYTSSFTSVVIDSNSQFPSTGISDAVGTVIRCRIPDDGYGRAGWFERTSV